MEKQKRIMDLEAIFGSDSDAAIPGSAERVPSCSTSALPVTLSPEDEAWICAGIELARGLPPGSVKLYAPVDGCCPPAVVPSWVRETW
jgi:hypothetical protein